MSENELDDIGNTQFLLEHKTHTHTLYAIEILFGIFYRIVRARVLFVSIRGSLFSIIYKLYNH